MKAVILAAGSAERLRPFTETRAKPMIRVAGRPILESMLLSLREAGIREVLLVVNHCRQGIEAYLEHGDRLGMSLDYVLQEPVDGIGAGLLRCRQALGEEPFLLVYGDVLTTGAPFAQVVSQYAETGGPIAALALPSESRDFGNVYLDGDMRIQRFLEKPEDGVHANYVLAGLFLLPPHVFELLEERNADMEAVYQALVAEGGFHGSLWEGGWIDIGHPWQILEANRMVMDLWEDQRIHSSVKLEGNVHVEGPVHIEPDVVVGAGSVLKGPCYIGHGSFVGNNTLVREYTALGPDSVVGYGTELKNCVLFGRSVLGRLSFIGDSVIGERVELGTGVTTVNYHSDDRTVQVETESGLLDTGMAKVGAFIGDDVNIGARHVLAPGTRIRAGSRVPDLITLRSIL